VKSIEKRRQQTGIEINSYAAAAWRQPAKTAKLKAGEIINHENENGEEMIDK
jgi:hypothetical protein